MGKGSKIRPRKVPYIIYSENYDKIFRKKKEKTDKK